VEWDHTRRNPGFTEREVPKMLRAALRNSQTSIDERDIVCRVMRLYLDGVRLHQDKAMDEVNPAFTPEYDIPLGYEDLEEWLQEMIVEVNLYHLPVNGLVIADESPNDPDAFPETHFIHRFHHHDQ
jgi:hypothetical protein